MVCVRGEPGLDSIQLRSIAMYRARPIETDDVPHTRGKQDLRAGDARRSDAGDDDPERLPVAVGEAEGIDQARQHHHCCSVLVVMVDWDVELGVKPALDLEAARGRDVLQVDPAEDGRDRLYSGDDLLYFLSREANREGIDLSELAKKHRLA